MKKLCSLFMLSLVRQVKVNLKGGERFCHVRLGGDATKEGASSQKARLRSCSPMVLWAYYSVCSCLCHLSAESDANRLR